MKSFSSQEIYNDLEKLGVSPGDILLCKVNLLSIGLVSKDPRNGFLKALLRYLGSEGTIVVPAYTKTYFAPFINKNKKIFSINEPPTTGGFVKSVFSHPEAVRSSHPTNSFLAIGKYANSILAGHDHRSHSYQPVQVAMELGAKGLLVGCLRSMPGHFTAHLAQHHLGLSTKNLFSGLVGACFFENGILRTFYRKDIGGDASGAEKFYKHYEASGVISYGPIGNSQSGISILKDAYAIEKGILSKDPKFMLCDNPLCFSCRATWKYNMTDLPWYVTRKAMKEIKKIGW